MDLSFILDLIPTKYAAIASAIIAACSALASVIKPPKDGSAWAIPYKALNIVAFNVKWAANHYSTSQQNKAG